MNAPSPSLAERRIIQAAWVLAAVVLAGAAFGAEEKPEKAGFLSRIGKIVDMVRKKEPAPAPPPPVEKPQPEKKPAVTVSKSKPSASTAKKAAPKKAETKGPSAVAKKEPEKQDPAKAGPKPESKPQTAATTPAKAEPAKKEASPPPATEPAKKMEVAVTTSDGTSKTSPPPSTTVKTDGINPKDGEFSHDDDSKPMDVTSSAKTDSVKTPVPQLTEPAKPATPTAPLPPSRGSSWQIVKIGGRDYVTAESIQRFYFFSSLKFEKGHLWLRSPNLILKGQIGSQELLINNIKFILSYPVSESGGKALISRLDLCKLIDPVLRPSHITGDEPFNTIVLDAGHGGHDSGAKGVYGYEKDFALQLARVVRDALIRRGFKVIMTRDSDVFISRTGRVALANKTPNSIFISLHFNSSGGSAATGIETFALTPQGSSASLERGGGYNSSGLTGNRQDSENIALATAVHAMVVHKFKVVDRGIKRAQWTVLTGCQKPGILFEGGFVTNRTECQFIASPNYRSMLAETIADAVINYRKALQTPPVNMAQPSTNPYRR